MAMPSLPIDDDKDLDDATLWAVIDSAAASAASSTSRFRKPQTLKNPNLRSSPQILLPPSPSPSPSSHQKLSRVSRNYTLNNSPRVSFEDWDRPQKIARLESTPDLNIVKRAPVTPMYSSPDSGKFSFKDISPYAQNNSPRASEGKENFTHCLAGRFPTVSLFKDYQDAAIKILEKSDYTIISGSPFIKKSGWRKIAFYFNISFEIKDKNIEFDENRNVQRAEFVVRAYMQGGRFSDGWGSCDRREKRFLKPNNDIPSTAETRAKNKACQDLLGIGAYRTSVSHSHSPC